MIKNEGKTGNRIIWIDLLRILMTWMVVSIHGKCIECPEIIGRQWFEFRIVEAIPFCAVPVFFMISGALVLYGGDCSIQKSLKRVFYVLKLIILQAALCTGVVMLNQMIAGEESLSLSYVFEKWGGVHIRRRYVFPEACRMLSGGAVSI